MKVINENKLKEYIDNNKSLYGKAIIDYAIRWANLMEKQISEGKEITDIAKQTSYEANIKGVTGFGYGCAVSVLAQCWEYGETLRRWHNLDVQLQDEGIEANKDGGTLNPAIWNIVKHY